MYFTQIPSNRMSRGTNRAAMVQNHYQSLIPPLQLKQELKMQEKLNRLQKENLKLK